VLSGPGIGDVRMPDMPSRLRTPPAAATLGPRYTVTCTGFGQPLPATGWLRGTPQLTATLTRLGIPAGASLPSAASSAASVPAAPAPAAAPKPTDTTAPAWLIATIASTVAIVIAGTALWLRRHPPACP
jgi:hypothetical protein